MVKWVDNMPKGEHPIAGGNDVIRESCVRPELGDHDPLGGENEMPIPSPSVNHIIILTGQKRCPNCRDIKPFFDFQKNLQRKDGLQVYCRKCTAEKNCKWYEEHREERLATCKLWKLRHSERMIIYSRTASKKRYATQKGKLNCIMSGMIRRSLMGNKRRNHWENLVNYTIEQLKKHLERQFTPEMTWDNYGSYWHIDHKIPISAFNYENPEDLDFKKCWNLKNLRPLEAKDNWNKSDKIDKPFQPSLNISLINI